MMTIVLIGGILLFMGLVLVAGVFVFLRQRAASPDEPVETKRKAQRATHKRVSPKGSAQRRAKTNGKPSQSQPVKPSTLPKPDPAAASSPATPAPPIKQPAADKPPSGEKIRILIVDDNAGTRENVTRLLYFEDDLEVVGQALNGRQGVEMAVELKPHIVLMDINMPDMDGITATQKMGVEVPFSQVVIMSVQADQHYMKRAMTAGARDFQPKPFTSEELVSCIRRVYNIGLPTYRQFEAAELARAQQAARPAATAAQEKEEAIVIVVYGPKGGVGTSAIASNLAVALQQQQGDTILMDAALQFGDVLVHLNTRASRTVIDLIHENGLETDLLSEILIPHKSGLKLLLGPPRPEMADAITPSMITEVINGLKSRSKVVVVDTTSQLTSETLAVLDSADYVLVITIPELPAIKNTRLFLELAEELGIKPNRLKVVINRANELGGVRPDKVEQVLKLEHAHLVPHDHRLEAALRKGISICQQDAAAPSALAIVDMAQQVWQELTEIETSSVEENA